MHPVMHVHLRWNRLREPAVCFWLLCFAGIFLGTFCAANADPVCFSLMRQTVDGQVSIVCLIAAQLLPFLFAAYVAYISKPWLIAVVCSLKLFSFAFVGYLIWAAFGSAGWLIRLLFLFTDLISVPVLIWFCLRKLCNSFWDHKEFWACVGITIAAVVLDIFWVAPILAKMIDF